GASPTNLRSLCRSSLLSMSSSFIQYCQRQEWSLVALHWPTATPLSYFELTDQAAPFQQPLLLLSALANADRVASVEPKCSSGDCFHQSEPSHPYLLPFASGSNAVWPIFGERIATGGHLTSRRCRGR